MTEHISTYYESLDSLLTDDSDEPTVISVQLNQRSLMNHTFINAIIERGFCSFFYLDFLFVCHQVDRSQSKDSYEYKLLSEY